MSTQLVHRRATPTTSTTTAPQPRKRSGPRPPTTLCGPAKTSDSRSKARGKNTGKAASSAAPVSRPGRKRIADPPQSASSAADGGKVRRSLASAPIGDIQATMRRAASSVSTGTRIPSKDMSQTKTLKMVSPTGPTIRTVPSFEGNTPWSQNSSPSDQEPPSATTTRSSATTVSPAPDTGMSTFSSFGSISGRTRPSTLDPAAARNGTMSSSQPDDGTGANSAAAPTTASDAPSPGAWDSTIGKAGLGKTGRVINKLVDENETLKRDIKLERLRAEEARQAAKLVEDKMERSVAEYESRLLEANVVRTLLARKERQLEELSSTIERHRQRADAALERERGWRDELEKVRTQSTQQVDAANVRAELMEGRYNVLASQWGSQEGAIQKLREDIKAVTEERLRDDERIATLRDLCDQQDSNIRHLRAEKEKIGEQFEAYKRAQEDGLRSIKDKARRQEEQQEKLLEETREALHKLRWALSVQENVSDAQ